MGHVHALNPSKQKILDLPLVLVFTVMVAEPQGNTQRTQRLSTTSALPKTKPLVLVGARTDSTTRYSYKTRGVANFRARALAYKCTRRDAMRRGFCTLVLFIRQVIKAGMKFRKRNETKRNGTYFSKVRCSYHWISQNPLGVLAACAGRFEASEGTSEGIGHCHYAKLSGTSVFVCKLCVYRKIGVDLALQLESTSASTLSSVSRSLPV